MVNHNLQSELIADTSSRFYPIKTQELNSEKATNMNNDNYNNQTSHKHSYCNYPNEYMRPQQQTRNNDYINYTETFDKTYAEESAGNLEPERMEKYVGLGYVQLEIVMSQNSTQYYAKTQNKTYERTLNPNGSKMNYGRGGQRLSDQSDRMYTSCDILRTQALKQTKDELQRS